MPRDPAIPPAPDYSALLDPDVRAFIDRTNAFYPADAATRSIAEQRAVYDRMCAAFDAPHPEGVTSADRPLGGVPCRGTVKCHIFPAYDSAVMAMTAALSEASQWPAYSSWLPLVAEQISATSGAAFGRRGIMAQNLKNSMAFAEAARQYRDWSQRNWQQVTDDRNASQDRRAYQVRENLGGVQTYANPFGTNAPPVQLPTTYKYYWSDNQGNYLGSDDPSANPNVGSTREWRQMPRRER